MAFCQPRDWTQTAKLFCLATGHLIRCITLCVCWGSQRRDTEQIQAKSTTRCKSDAVQRNTTAWALELLLKKFRPWIYGRLHGLWGESSGVLKGGKPANTIHYEYSYCNRKANWSRKGNRRTAAALGEDIPGRMKKPRTKTILTCSRNTVHSSFVHIHRCSHGTSWVCARTWRHAHMGSSYIHQHSLFQSTLGRQGHKITATIEIYDLHVSKRPSILNLYTNNTSSIISRFPLRYCQKEGTLFPLSKKDSRLFLSTVC